ncbi:MAG: hypothetical protein V3U65_14220 [Granulosicoccaceae bacterium]
MTQLNNLRLSSKLQMLTATVLLLTAVGCGGGTDLPPTSGQTLPESPSLGGEQPSDDPDIAKPVEQITAATGVQIVYANPEQQSNIDGDYIDSQWVQMQTCLQITAQTPTVNVVSGRITPLTADDDVLRYVDGSVLATATVTSTDTTIQITEADFDGSLGANGNNLRSIFGRYLWFSASLPERDYQYECAKQ